jgi:phosphohistidine phosphatase
MKLAIMRHGPAEDGSPAQHDSDRALTPDGRARVRIAASMLAAEAEGPLYIVSSPLVRSVQTAEIVATGCEVETRGGVVVIERGVSPGGNLLAVLGELRIQRRKRVLLVGHEPSVGAVVSELLGRFLPRGFSKAMVVGLSIQDEPTPGDVWGAKFRYLVDPKSARFDRDPERVFT